MKDLIFKGTVDEIDVGKLRVGLLARIKVGRPPDRRRHRQGLAHRAAGAAEGRRDALRRRDRARPRRRDVTLRAGYSANADLIIREKKDILTIPERLVTLRGRREEDLRRAPGREGQGSKVEPKKIAGEARHLGRPERRGRRGAEEGRQGRPAAPERDLVTRWTTVVEVFRQLLRDVRSQKLRTFLTVFGIVWGTVAVTLLLAFGTGLKKQLVKNTAGLGDRICIAWPGLTSIPYQGLGKGRRIRLTEEDIEFVRPRGRGARGISSEYDELDEAPLRAQDLARRRLRRLARVRPDAEPDPAGRAAASSTRRTWTSSGASSSSATSSPRTSSASETAVGKTVMLWGSPFLVVGVLKPKTQDSSYSGRDNDKAFIPGTTFRALTGEKYVDNVIYQADPAFGREDGDGNVLADPRQAEEVRPEGQGSARRSGTRRSSSSSSTRSCSPSTSSSASSGR